MPFKSEAHRKKLRELHAKGFISKEVLERFDKDTPAVIPEVLPKKDKVPSNKVWFAKVIK